jgi:hypothetical protein
MSTEKALREERIKQENDFFNENLKKVRLLLEKHNALDLEDMILSGMENVGTYIHINPSLNGNK